MKRLADDLDMTVRDLAVLLATDALAAVVVIAALLVFLAFLFAAIP